MFVSYVKSLKCICPSPYHDYLTNDLLLNIWYASCNADELQSFYFNLAWNSLNICIVFLSLYLFEGKFKNLKLNVYQICMIMKYSPLTSWSHYNKWFFYSACDTLHVRWMNFKVTNFSIAWIGLYFMYNCSYFVP